MRSSPAGHPSYCPAAPLFHPSLVSLSGAALKRQVPPKKAPYVIENMHARIGSRQQPWKKVEKGQRQLLAIHARRCAAFGHRAAPCQGSLQKVPEIRIQAAAHLGIGLIGSRLGAPASDRSFALDRRPMVSWRTSQIVAGAKYRHTWSLVRRRFERILSSQSTCKSIET